MRYPQIRKGTFISRPNRFIAYVNLDGETVTCHVKIPDAAGSFWSPDPR